MNELWQWLWQGSLVAAAATCAVRLIPPSAAAKRHLVWWTALVVVIAGPLLQWLAASFGLGDSVALAPAARSPLAMAVPPPPSSWIWLATALWLAVAACGLLRLALNIRVLKQLLDESWRLDPSRTLRLPLWRAAARTATRPVDLRVARDISGACAIGFPRPTILISSDLVNVLDDEALEAIVLHEYAHLEQYDDWTRLVQQVVLACAGLHPGVRWISRQIDLEREVACDRLAIARVGAPWRYARALTHAAAVVMHGRGFLPSLVPGSSTGTSMLRARVRRAIARRPPLSRTLEYRAFAASLLLFAAALCAVVNAPPLLAFERQSGQLLLDAVRVWSPDFEAPHATVASLPDIQATAGDTASRRPVTTPTADSTTMPVLTQVVQDLSAMQVPGGAGAQSDQPPVSAAEGTLAATPLPAIDIRSAPHLDGNLVVSETPEESEPFTRLGTIVGTAGAGAGERAAQAGRSIGRFFKSGGLAVARTF